MPDSGVQFLDLSIPRSAVDSTTRPFVEEKLKIGSDTVWALAPSRGEPDSTQRPVFSVSGRQAIAAALDQWLPLPILRFVARDGTGRARFDQGPFNWARLYIASPAAGDDAGFYRAVVAFDTRTDASSRMDLTSYTMPTADDVQFASSFAMSDDAEELASFLAEDWVQDWLRTTFPTVEVTGPHRAPQTAGLQQVAGYLTLLTVLRRAAVMPSLQFFETRADAVAPIPVDLVLDLGTARSCAMLVESAGGRPQLSDAALLTLRDLGRPTLTYRGAFDSRIAFSRPTFGHEALSRKSGRPDAFSWPSLVRTGPEATRIAADTRGADGAITIASPKAHLRDLKARAEMWRFAPDPREKVRRAPMIAGRLLAVAAPVAGLLAGPSGTVKPIASRPQYPLSAMTTFQIAEIVLQAMSAINAPILSGVEGRAEAVRRLRQVIVTAPLTMPREERDLLRERADEAIDLLWRALEWETTPQAPQKPVVRLGLDETLSAQLVYLFDAIGHRSGGEPRAFLDVIGKSRPGFGVQPCFRLAAIDCGGGHTTMSIVTYGSSAEAPIQPKLLGAQRSTIAGGAILDNIAHTLLLPAIATAVAAAGGEAPLAFLDKLITQPAADKHEPHALGTRLNDLWLRPSATALLQMVTDLGEGSAYQTLSMRLGDLAGATAGLAPPVASELNVAIEAIRAAPIDLASIAISLRVNDIQAAIRNALEPMVASISRALVASDCDVVLLTGWAARHPMLRSLLLQYMPWRPDRIIPLTDYGWQAWYPMKAEDRAAADGKDIALVGALLALAGGEGLGFGGGESGFPFASEELGANDGAWAGAERRAAGGAS